MAGAVPTCSKAPKTRVAFTATLPSGPQGADGRIFLAAAFAAAATMTMIIAAKIFENAFLVYFLNPAQTRRAPNFGLNPALSIFAFSFKLWEGALAAGPRHSHALPLEPTFARCPRH